MQLLKRGLMQPYSANDLNFSSVNLIRSQLSTLTTAQLTLETEAFRDHIVAAITPTVTQPLSPEQQQQKIHSLQFYWGHDHDFGAFQVAGQMGTRHIWMLSRFFDHFGLDPTSLAGKNILDIGCWTGGVSLVLAKLGANVVGIDEIGMYPAMLAYQAQAFGLDNLTARQLSLYDLGSADFINQFDMIFCLGVIYHLSDPIIGLRHLYNALKPGGSLFLESMSIDVAGCVCEYEGPNQRRGQFGWNWFVPSPRAIGQLLGDVGFESLQVGNGIHAYEVTSEHDPMGSMRCFARGQKQPGHVICKAGLSTVIA